MTVTPKKLAANRANAKKSTGPRSREGKNRSKQNGVTHGIFCADIVLPGEKWDVFEAFRHAYLLQLRPLDIVELMLVDRIVNAAWKLRRLNSVEYLANRRGALDMVEAQDREVEESRQKVFDHYRGHEHNIPKELVEDDSIGAKSIEEKVSEIDGVTALTGSFVAGLNDMERIGRHTQRLELSMYCAMRQLERVRKEKRETRKRTQSGEEPILAYCPFLPEDAQKIDRAEPRVAHHQNEQSEPKAAAVARVSNPRRTTRSSRRKSMALARALTRVENPCYEDIAEGLSGVAPVSNATSSQAEFSGTLRKPLDAA